MPVYRFYCDDCQLEFEKYLSFKEHADTMVCPNGHGKARRLFSPPAIIFKGNGWYSTDHRTVKNTGSD